MKHNFNITKYIDYFHDGTLLKIEKTADGVIFTMCTAEIDLTENKILSKDNRLKGKLHLEKLKELKISNKPSLNEINEAYDQGTILDFEITNKRTELGISWTSYYPKKPTNEFSTIEIEAEKIWWENIPDLKVP